MDKLLQHLISTEFRDLAGSRLEGQLALSDELVNLGIADVLKQLTTPADPTTEATIDGAPATPSPDPKALLRHATVHHLRYRTEVGRTILEIKAEV